MNINRNPAYADLRAIRNQLSSDGVPLTSVEAALALTHGLSKYSERGQDYVNDLQLMINTNAKYWQESN
jgi:Bax protein